MVKTSKKLKVTAYRTQPKTRLKPYKQIPGIVLQGDLLLKYGFNIDTYVSICFEDQQITIRPMIQP